MNFIDETSEDLSALIVRDLGPLPQGVLTNRIVLDWMHYRARLIPCRPRLVVVAPQVAALRDTYPAINQLKAALEVGADVSPWLSERVRKQRSNLTADLMFNDWQISHFHLGRLFERANKIGPRPHGRPLLFAHVKADRAILLDVQPHGSWTMQRILGILRDLSPDDLPELKGILPPGSGSSPTDEQLRNLRQNGYTAPTEISGKVFAAPGLGQSTLHHATRMLVQAHHLAKRLAHLHEALAENRLPWYIQMQLAGRIGLPVRLGLTLDAGCLVVYEKMRGIEFFRLPAFE
ncbi:hypothetical protein [Bradyrhizobium neotropicale]|uniref:Uncharacterized protein n=1 Tax=Bradyrhizobium neotropicale TaxID=1497615 RepID=A0A176YPM7_9BRAD|nr:hypothetical protein [Bradyrhizobium neotropicale]OAF09229.1 hypothetical protein AXW67_26905 [Bradyrhizobium neotropicale]